MAQDTYSLSLQYYVVGFFDLLGQQEYLRNLRSLPDKTDETALASTRETLRHTYGAVTGMRQMFSDSFNTYIRKPIEASALPPEKQSIYRQMDNNPIQFQGISDSVVVFLSLRTTDDAKLPVRGILGILTAAAMTSIGSIGVGHPIRGGIDIGIGFQPSPNEIYGPALSRAYSLESRIANYPRIVIGDELSRYLYETGGQQPTDEFASQSKKIATDCIQCLAYDDDGIPFVDYLGPYFCAVLGDSGGDASFIDQAYQRVIEFSTRYKNEKNSKLAFRYTLLRNYFEDRLPLWADLPRKAKT